MRISDWSSDVCSSDLAAKAAVQEANVGTIMCSYPRINGTYACENSFLLRDVLRDDWGFRGYVLADYLAAPNAAASFNGGLDFEPWPRSEQRRVGEECVSQCISRWSPDSLHKKKK